jgi:type VI secretion system secreted protein VgrG
VLSGRPPESPFGSPRGPLFGPEPEIAPLEAPAALAPVVAGPERPYVKDDTKPGWVEIVLIDDEGRPAAGEVYRVRLPDGSVAEGVLGFGGTLRLEGIDPGDCEVSFPNLDAGSWERLEEAGA